MTKTNIVATLGPRALEKDFIKKIVQAGASILRINCSHANPKAYAQYVAKIRQQTRGLKSKVYIMQDLQGPRIRVGKINPEGMLMKMGEKYIFCHDKAQLKKASIIHITDPYLHLSVKTGEPLFLCNGDIEMKVTAVKNGCISAQVINGGVLFSNKAINVPRTTLRQGGLTVKDIKDVKNALRHGVDYVALSFVQSADDVNKLRKIIKNKKVKIIAKIERAVALKHIDEIIQAADGIMIARGDLGVEVPYEQVPIIQKNLIRHAHWHNKSAIIATQMMTSMIRHPHPTRAEVSDIANAVLDGGDGILLSDETAAGEYPIQSVAIAQKVIKTAENYLQLSNSL